MSETATNIARMVDILPVSEQLLAQELIKRLVLAWDPDFTKATPEEMAEMAAAEQSGFIPAEEIDWDNLGIYNS